MSCHANPGTVPAEDEHLQAKKGRTGKSFAADLNPKHKQLQHTAKVNAQILALLAVKAATHVHQIGLLVVNRL